MSSPSQFPNSPLPLNPPHRNLLAHNNILGNGIATLTDPPANLTSGPGLQYLATAVQAYLALYGGVSLVVPGIFYFWPSNTNSFYHGATTYVPGGAVDVSAAQCVRVMPVGVG